MDEYNLQQDNSFFHRELLALIAQSNAGFFLIIYVHSRIYAIERVRIKLVLLKELWHDLICRHNALI